MTSSGAVEEAQRAVRLASRAVARCGLVTAYGHCSARIDASTFTVTPLGVPGAVGTGQCTPIVGVDGPLPEDVAGEVRVHQAIYRRRPDVGGICRVHPPVLVALSTQRVTPRARHGHGAYFAPAPPLWDSPRLVRDDQTAAAVADALGAGNAIVLRGNGAVTVGPDLRAASVVAWFLEDAARVELVAHQLGGHLELTGAEAAARATWAGDIAERMWDHMTARDTER
ncbi:MAG TPA: class II aldolase/adducin family protein [Acidimicrobiales bacterium]|nr:class II aldolase/adducin family protein [Acidimicrobiales bacterium]